MELIVTCLRDRGQRLPPKPGYFRPVAGRVSIHKMATRDALIARLLDASDNDLLPHLCPAHLVKIEPRGLLIAGIEQFPKGNKDVIRYTQTGWCRVPPPYEPNSGTPSYHDYSAYLQKLEAWKREVELDHRWDRAIRTRGRT